MNPAGFLLIALVVGILGGVIVASRNRTSRSPDSAMEEFRREMDALAPHPTSAQNEPRPGVDPPLPPKKPFRPVSLDKLNVRSPEAGNRDSSRLGGRFGPEPDSRSGAGSDVW